MSAIEMLKRQIGDASYSRLEKEADAEVGLAKKMPLVDQNHQEKFYAQRFLLADLLADCELFERRGLTILPTDVVKVLFRCKLVYATNSEHEYLQRRGGYSLFREAGSTVRWEERTEALPVLVDRHVAQLQAEIEKRTLVAPISSFLPNGQTGGVQVFFDALFAKLRFPFESFIDNENLIEKHKQLEPGLPAYDQTPANRFFCAPSIGFTTRGSREYCFWYSSMWLRTLLNLLRIAGYIHPGQMDFGRDAKMDPPTYPVFLGEHAQGSFQWHEDKKQAWVKIPDGCLFRSFGYRGLSSMWLDHRTFGRIEEFVLDHKRILDCLENPWCLKSIRDVVPTLDILSSATQIPDLGAKILLVYCCLEHLFVPKDVRSENKKYIEGGLNALGANLLPWFNRLYNLRSNYAHKGYVLRDDETMGLVRDSMKNAMALLVAKLSVA